MTKGLRTISVTGPVAKTMTHVPTNVPLGTATWHTFPKGVTPACQKGDLFLGCLPSGGAVGYNDDRHVMITAGTRSGKGASFIIPNLAFWAGSVFCIDPRGENAMVTARRRGPGSPYCKGKKQKVRLLDPFGIVSTYFDSYWDLKAQFNPLDLLLLHPGEAVDLAAQIAESLIIKESSNDPFWEDSARALIKAVILHVMSWPGFAEHERNLVTLWRLLRKGQEASDQNDLLHMNGDAPLGAYASLFDSMCRNAAYDEVVSNAGARFGALAYDSPRSFQGMVQVACTSTDFIDSPQMRRSLSGSTFALSDLKTDPKGVSVYLCLPERYMESHNRWLRMIVTLMLNEMQRISQQPRCGHPVLAVLDEFPNLGRMKAVELAVAQIAGRGVKLVMASQSLCQLADIYKENWETLVANCGVKLFHNNDDHRTREYVAKLIGEHEVVRTTNTRSATTGTSSSTTLGETVGSNQSTGSTYTSGFSHSAQGMGSNHSSTASFTRGFSSSVSASKTSGQSQSTTQGTSESIHKRYLVNPDEVGRFFSDPANPRAIVLISGMQPLCLNRIQYFSHDAFAGWFDYHSDHPLPRTLEQVAQDRDRTSRERAAAAMHKREHEEAERQRKQQEEADKANARDAYWAQQRQYAAEREAQRRKATIRKVCGMVLGTVGGLAGIWVTAAIAAYINGEPLRRILVAFSGW